MYTAQELLHRIEDELEEDIFELIDSIHVDGPGACEKCGDIFVHVPSEEDAGWCDACGEDSIKSLTVLAEAAKIS